MSDAIDPAENSSINQIEYLKLFMQELTYQDPLKPVDNKEFMSQMAQFSNLQVAQESKALLSDLKGMTGASQALNLIGKLVRLKESNETGRVSKVSFSDNESPRLSVYIKTKSSNVDDIMLDNISEVLNEVDD